MIIICHGMVKSASSFATQLVIDLIKINKINILSLKEFIPESNGLYFAHDQNFLSLLDIALPKLANDCLVIKSHSDFPFNCKNTINSEKILAISTFRNPAEISLSLIDAGKKDEALGRVRFNAYKTVSDTLEAIDWQIKCFANWILNSKNIMPIYYDDLVFDTINTVKEVGAHLGLELNQNYIEKNKNIDHNTIWEFNKGIPSRANNELDSITYDALKNRWKDFYNYIESKDPSYLRSYAN